eukprot:403371751
MVSLVTKFEVNISDLASLMILPDILTVIQQRLLQDRTLLVDLGIIPQVILQNQVRSIFIENEFDSFELANKFKQYSRFSQDIKLFEVISKMASKTELGTRILRELMIGAEDFLLDESIVYAGNQGMFQSIDILDLIFKRTQALIIDSTTLKHITMQKEHGSGHKNVKKLTILELCYYEDKIYQLAKIFPQLEYLYVTEICMENENFFGSIKILLKDNTLEHLKSFKVNLQYSDESSSIISELDYLFPIVVGIQVPKIKLRITVQNCKREKFLKGFFSFNLSSIFPNYKVQVRDEILQRRDLEQCNMVMIFKKNIENENVYRFDIVFTDW